MVFKILLMLMPVGLSSCFLLQNSAVVYRVNKSLPNTAPVYSLPYAPGTSHRVWQGYHSVFSHLGNFAVDFKMKPGTVIHAARSGVVVAVKDHCRRGGLARRFVGRENAVVVRHNDGSYAHYLHIQHKGALVQLADSVQRGQPIALSGGTGFSAFPHLHFEVTPAPPKANGEIPVRFYTEKGIGFLQPLQRYTAF